MAKQITGVEANIYQYILDCTLREQDILKRLREETNRMQDVAAMQVSPDQGQFMAMLVQLIAAGKILEVGCFTGYSSLAMALTWLQNEQPGKIVTCDVSEQWTSIARRYWQEAGVENLVELRLGPALDSLQQLLDQGDVGFDLAFIDADKTNYKNYYEYCLKLLRRGGLILVDNVFWGGDVLNEDKIDADTVAIREFNQMLSQDPRVEVSMLAIGDGLTLARIR